MLTKFKKEVFPDIEGLEVRTMNLDEDLSELIELLNANAQFNGLDEYYAVDEMRNFFTHLNNFDLVEDLILVKINQKLVGYQRVSWQEIPLEDKIAYRVMGTTHPDWLEKGIGTAMVTWGENRLFEISLAHDHRENKVFQAYTNSSVKSRVDLLKNNAYLPARHFYLMERKDLKNIPSIALPDGIVLRPPKNEADWRKAVDCLNDAFKDHWGYSEITETDIQRFLNDPYKRADLTQLAWDGDEVVGTVIVFVNTVENDKLNQSRAWTEEITVRRPYRGQGIAKAMIYSAMEAVKNDGLKTVVLGVDTNNPNGALKLYQNCGYETYETSITFEKPL